VRCRARRVDYVCSSNHGRSSARPVCAPGGPSLVLLGPSRRLHAPRRPCLLLHAPPSREPSHRPERISVRRPPSPRLTRERTPPFEGPAEARKAFCGSVGTSTLLPSQCPMAAMDRTEKLRFVGSKCARFYSRPLTGSGGFAPAAPVSPSLAGPREPAPLRRARPWRDGLDNGASSPGPACHSGLHRGVDNPANERRTTAA
jgi:hypothetical protein